MNLIDNVKYLWLFCKNRKLLIKDKYFADIYNAEVNLVQLKPAYHDETCWQYLTPIEAYYYLKGMVAALTSITMKNL